MKLIGLGALLVVAFGGLIYSLSSASGGDAISTVTESGDGQPTMRKLTCGKCGYEEEVTSAVYQERMKDRADPNQWLECPKCHENAVQRANSGTPFGMPAAPDSTVATGAPANQSGEPSEEAPAVPEIKGRTMTP